MPRSVVQNEAIRAESRAKILNAALRLFAQHGYEQTSVKMIAQEAGIAQGLLYNYYASKQQLLIAIFEQSIAAVRESFTLAEQQGPPEQLLERYIRVSFMLLRRDMAFWRLSYHVRMQVGVIAGLGEQLQAWTTTIHTQISDYFSTAGFANPRIEAALLFALIDGVSQHYVLDPERYPLDAIIETMVARYKT